MKIGIVRLSAAILVLALTPALAVGKKEDKKPGGEEKAEMKAGAQRERIDQIASDALARLFKESQVARELHADAYGYAVFDNTKVAFILSGGGGVGVAVNKDSGDRTYMKMGTAGIGVGLGAHTYQVVFLFENKSTFDAFVDKGWAAEASANAVAGTAGANAEATFKHGIALFQLTDAGLMLQADIAGSKYWKNKKLN